MKRITLFLISILITSISFSQTLSEDLVYPLDGSDPLTNCEIQDIKQGNIVYFIQNGKEQRMEAIAVKRNGEYIDLSEFAKEAATLATPGLDNQPNSEMGTYNGYDYNYYSNLQKKAKSQKTTGAVLTIGGLGLFFIGVGVAANAGYNEATGTFDNESKAATAGLLEIGGLIMTVAGIPVWITGRI